MRRHCVSSFLSLRIRSYVHLNCPSCVVPFCWLFFHVHWSLRAVGVIRTHRLGRCIAAEVYLGLRQLSSKIFDEVIIGHFIIPIFLPLQVTLWSSQIKRGCSTGRLVKEKHHKWTGSSELRYHELDSLQDEFRWISGCERTTPPSKG